MKMQIGTRIRKIREARGLPITKMGLSRSFLCRIELGDGSLSLAALEHICERLDVGLWRLFIPWETHLAMLTLEDALISAALQDLLQLTTEQRRQLVTGLAARHESAEERPRIGRPTGASL